MINADLIAKERGIKFSHSYNSQEMPYLNLIKCIVTSNSEVIEVAGNVYSENHIRIVNIMGFEIDLNPYGPMLFIKNKDVPGVIGKIGTILGNFNVNIAGYLLSRIEKKDFAYAVVKLDDVMDEVIVGKIKDIEEIIDLKQLNL